MTTLLPPSPSRVRRVVSFTWVEQRSFDPFDKGLEKEDLRKFFQAVEDTVRATIKAKNADVDKVTLVLMGSRIFVHAHVLGADPRVVKTSAHVAKHPNRTISSNLGKKL